MGVRRPLTDSEIVNLRESRLYRASVKAHGKPRNLDLTTLAKAGDEAYWKRVRLIQRSDQSLRPITLEMLAKRVQANIKYYANLPKRSPFERQREKFKFYTREEHDHDIAWLEACRAELRTMFVASQNGIRLEGYRTLDGLAYKRKDDALVFQILACGQRLRACAAIIIASKQDKRKGINTPKQNQSPNWHNLDTQNQADAFRQGGYKTRVIEIGRAKQHQVLVRPG